jgi:hypothetical protein
MHTRLRNFREGRGFETQKEFCRHANKYGYRITLRRYGDVERGKALPSIYEVRDICEAMKISADAWIFGVESRVNLSGLDPRSISILSKMADVLRNEQ